jgi:hypothetical protein
MAYRFTMDREPTDEELQTLMASAIKKAKARKHDAINAFKERLHNEIQQIKSERENAIKSR